MGGKGETVRYTKTNFKNPLTPAEKDQLIKDLTKTINDATSEIVIITLVKARD
jgi:CRISPR/Cas system-associated endoribonuclease Cas2